MNKATAILRREKITLLELHQLLHLDIADPAALAARRASLQQDIDEIETAIRELETN